MKVSATIFALAGIIISTAYCKDINDAQFSACLVEANIGADVIKRELEDKPISKDYNYDSNVKCFAKCLLAAENNINEHGDFVEENFRKSTLKKQGKPVDEILLDHIKKCVDVIEFNDDVCEQGFEVYKCIVTKYDI